MKPLDIYNLNNISYPMNPDIKNNNNINNILYENDNKYLYSSQINPLYNNKKDVKTTLNMGSETPSNNLMHNIIQSNITKAILTSPLHQPSNLYNINPYSNTKEKDEFNKTQKYINYLKDHLNSSYYANNEINNKNSNLLEKTKTLNEEIINNNIIYEKLLKSIEQKTKENNHYKKNYESILDKHRKIKNNNDNINLNVEEKIKDLKQKHLIMNKENQSKEEIISNLKKTLEILEKNKLEKKKEKEGKIKKLTEEKEMMNKLKLNLEKITKDLQADNIKLEENKKSMIYLINNNKNNIIKGESVDPESDEILYTEINKLQNIVENQKILLNKMKDSQREIKEKINEEKKNFNRKKMDNSDNNKYRKLLMEEKLKNKQLVMNLIESNKEAKELTKVHNQIKNKYEEEIKKIKDNIETILKNKKLETKNNKNIDYRKAYTQLLEEKKNLKMFNDEFKEKLNLKKAIEEKIELMKKENEKLKNIINNSNTNNIKLKNQPPKNINNINNINTKKNINIIENDESEENDDKENKKNNIIQENQIKINIDGAPVNKDSSVYTITDKGKLFTFNIIQKKFTTVNTNLIEGWKDFIEIYLSYYDGSLLLNTFEGLYILTGNNFSDLYYYCQEKNSISKIISFNYGHKYGGLILSPNRKELIAIGGCETKEVEVLNLEENTIGELPDLLTERINSSYSFIGENLLYAFLGEDNNTIEYLDLNEESKEWKNVEYTNNGVENIYGHISVPINENEVIIVGGKNNRKMMMFNNTEKYLEITDNKIPFLESVGEYLFDKDKNYNKMSNFNIIEKEKDNGNGNEIHQFICMDSKGNIHLFDNDFNYMVFLVDIHEI